MPCFERCGVSQSLETAHEWVHKKEEAVKSPQDKVAESAAKGHGRCLEQLQDTLVNVEQELKGAKGKQEKR